MKNLEILKRTLNIKMLVREDPANGKVLMPWDERALDGFGRCLYFTAPFDINDYPFLDRVRKYYEDQPSKLQNPAPAKINSTHKFAKTEDIGTIITYHPSWEGENSHYPEPICTVTIKDILKQIPKGFLKDVRGFEIVDSAIQNRVLKPRSFKKVQFVTVRLYSIPDEKIPDEIKNQEVIYKGTEYSAEEIRDLIEAENQ